MNKAELRIGNWVNDGEQNIRVSETTFAMNIDNYKPIRINQDIMIDFGFIAFSSKIGHENYYAKDPDYRFALMNGILHCSIGNNDVGVLFQQVKYIHELQNLYFTLQNEELSAIPSKKRKIYYKLPVAKAVRKTNKFKIQI